MTDLRRKAANGVRWTSLAALSTVAFQLIQLGVLGRYLQPADFGVIAIIQVAYGFLSIFTQSAFFEFVIQRQVLEHSRSSSLYWLNVGTALLFATILAIAAPLVAAVFSMDQLASMLPLVAIAIVLGSFGNLFEAIAQKGLVFSWSALAHVTAGCSGLAVSVVSVTVFQQGVWAYVWALLAATVARTLMLVGYGKRFGLWPALVFDTTFLPEIRGFVGYRMGAITTNFINTYADQFLIALLLGPTAAGLYNVASNLTLQPVRVFNPILVKIALPLFSFIQSDNLRLRRAFTKMLRFIAMIQAPALLGVMAVADPLVRLYLGSHWVNAIPVVQILAVYALTRSFVSLTGSLLLAKNKPQWSFRWNIALLLIVPLVILVSTQGGQITHVAVALVVLQLFIFAVQYFVLLRPLVGRFGAAYVGAIAPPLMFAVVMNCSVLVGKTLLPVHLGLPGLTIMIVLGVGTYAGLMFLFLGPETKEALRALTGFRTI